MTKMADYIAGPIQTTELAKQAFYTVRHNKQLVSVQVVGTLIAIVVGIATLLVAASSIFYIDTILFGGLAGAIGRWVHIIPVAALGYVMLIGGIILVEYLNVMVSYGALAAFAGQKVRVWQCILVATTRLPVIVQEFSMVRLSIQPAEQQYRAEFTAPVIAEYDITNYVDAITRSDQIFRQTWGAGSIAIDVAVVDELAYYMILLRGGILAFILHELLGQGGAVAGMIIMVVSLIASAVLFALLDRIITAALYYYAVTGYAPKGFVAADLHAAVTVQPQAYSSGDISGKGSAP